MRRFTVQYFSKYIIYNVCIQFVEFFLFCHFLHVYLNYKKAQPTKKSCLLIWLGISDNFPRVSLVSLLSISFVWIFEHFRKSFTLFFTVIKSSNKLQGKVYNSSIQHYHSYSCFCNLILLLLTLRLKLFMLWTVMHSLWILKISTFELVSFT